MDHCDPETIMPLLTSSPQAKVIAPHGVIAFLLEQGLTLERCIAVSEDEVVINTSLSITAIPAAHPKIEYDKNGYVACVGFMINFKGKKIYHSGDTSPDDYIIQTLQKHAPIDVALLPINEKNFYRDKAGIIGNMSIREAFGMAIDMSAITVVPMHYDMFKDNMVYLEELAVVYREQKPPFKLEIEPTELAL
jgi:L-ascorbate metabolism protein UlaG (beta-lactamase superfamily)